MMLTQNRLACVASFGLGICLAVMALLLLAGCTGAPRWGYWSDHPTRAQTLAALGKGDTYVYFPGYEIYYNRTQGYYVYWNGKAWLKRFEAPAGVNLTALLASPSVAVPFHDDPELHHADMVRSYPRDWGKQNPFVVSAR